MIVPTKYRLKHMVRSGTPAFRRLLKDFSHLDSPTKDLLRPYLLSSNLPESYWHRVIHRPLPAKSGMRLSFPATAYAAEDFLQLVYVTDTGFKVVIMGPRRYSGMVRLARKLVEEKKMYETFEELMGRTTPHPGDLELLIYIVHSISLISKMTDEPGGWCPSLSSDPADPDGPNGIPEIFISASSLKGESPGSLRRDLGATIAHEMFHAFQYAFSRETEFWIEESTATWAEDRIEKRWNTEQEDIVYAFNRESHSLKKLETEDEYAVYGMYLFPYFLTTNTPGDNAIMGQIWQEIGQGSTAIDAVKHSGGSNFEEIWKKYALATLDEKPHNKQLPDVNSRGGNAPLILNTVHEYNESELSFSGSGGVAVELDPLSISYHKIKNEHEGPGMPAVHFDLRDFREDNDVSLQSIIVYRDGRREYEDWSNREKRIFCLNNPKENFKEIYLAAANSNDKEADDTKEFQLNIYPDTEVDCLQGQADITLKVYGQETRNITKHYGSERDIGSSSWSRSVTVRLQLVPWREDIPPQLQGMLESMPGLYPEVEEYRMEIGRKAVEGEVQKPVSVKDGATGLTMMKYRVTSVQISCNSGQKRASATTSVEDSMGIVSNCKTVYSDSIQQAGLDDTTREWLKERWLKVEVFVHPATGTIRWVRMPLIEINRNLDYKSKTNCRKRYQDKQGNYHYKNTGHDSADLEETSAQLTFTSPGEKREGEPMDPVWKSEMHSKTAAFGRGKRIVPRDRTWRGKEQNGYISGKETTELSWKSEGQLF